MKNNEISLVMNTTEGVQSIRDSRDIRSVAYLTKYHTSQRPLPQTQLH